MQETYRGLVAAHMRSTYHMILDMAHLCCGRVQLRNSMLRNVFWVRRSHSPHGIHSLVFVAAHEVGRHDLLQS